MNKKIPRYDIQTYNIFDGNCEPYPAYEKTEESDGRFFLVEDILDLIYNLPSEPDGSNSIDKYKLLEALGK